MCVVTLAVGNNDSIQNLAIFIFSFSAMHEQASEEGYFTLCSYFPFMGNGDGDDEDMV